MSTFNNPLQLVDLTGTKVSNAAVEQIKATGVNVEYTKCRPLAAMNQATLESYTDKQGVHTIFNRRRSSIHQDQQAAKPAVSNVSPSIA